MLMKIILFACFAPLPLILYFVLRNETKPKKNLILGVTLPADARMDSAVKALCLSFRRQNALLTLLITFLTIPPFFLMYDSMVFTYFMTWLLLALAVYFILYAVYNKKLRLLKAENSWYGEAAGLALVDVKLAAMPTRQLSILWFLPPMVIGIIPAVYTACTRWGTDGFWPLFIAYVFLAAMVILFGSLYYTIYRQRAEVVDEDTSLNAVLTQVRRYNWIKFWMISAWLTGIFTLLFWALHSIMAQPVSVLAYTLLLFAVALHAEFKTRKIQQQLTQSSGKDVYTDEDDKWLFGLIYNNPADRHFMVNRRTGMGMTINLARIPGKTVMAVTAILLLSMPFWGIWMMDEEFTPVTLRTEETVIIAGHTSDEYRISYEDVESATLLSVLPEGRRTNGTGMASVLKGSFDLDGIGPCRLCLDPRTAPFIEIKTANQIYVLGSSDSNETYAVYCALAALDTGVAK